MTNLARRCRTAAVTTLAAALLVLGATGCALDSSTSPAPNPTIPPNGPSTDEPTAEPTDEPVADETPDANAPSGEEVVEVPAKVMRQWARLYKRYERVPAEDARNASGLCVVDYWAWIGFDGLDGVQGDVPVPDTMAFGGYPDRRGNLLIDTEAPVSCEQAKAYVVVDLASGQATKGAALWEQIQDTADRLGR